MPTTVLTQYMQLLTAENGCIGLCCCSPIFLCTGHPAYAVVRAVKYACFRVSPSYVLTPLCP